MTTDLRVLVFHTLEIRGGEPPCESAFPDTFIAHDGNLQAARGCCLQPQLEALRALRLENQWRSVVPTSTATALMEACRAQCGALRRTIVN